VKRDVEEERIEEAVEIEEPDRKKSETCNCKKEPKDECDHEYKDECDYEFEYGNKRMKLAHAYVPWQRYDEAFNPREALMKGTLFPNLYGVYPIPK
jgi:hypothetical protein